MWLYIIGRHVSYYVPYYIHSPCLVISYVFDRMIECVILKQYVLFTMHITLHTSKIKMFLKMPVFLHYSSCVVTLQ